MSVIKSVILMASLALSPAYAGDNIDVDVTGDIVASPCVFNGGDNTLNVNLGDNYAANMATPNSQSEPVAFALRFTQCPEGTRSINVQFTGMTDPLAGSDYYKNSGTAGQVAIGLRDMLTGNPVGAGTVLSRSVESDRTVTLPMNAWLYSRPGGVTPGTINSVVILTLQYN